jgi:hypothetical protein
MREYEGKEKGKEKGKDQPANIKKTNVEDCLFVVGERLVEVAPGLFLNRRSEAGGEVWIAQIKRPQIFRVLGAVLGAPQEGLPTLTQKQAIAKAKRWRSSIRGEKPLRWSDRTVAHAVRTYLTALGDSATIQKKRLSGPARRIIGSLGDHLLDHLEPRLLRFWAASLVQDPLYGDTKPSVLDQAVALGISFPPGSRSKVDGANRAISLLKAALELAYVNGWVVRDLAWRDLRHHRVPLSKRALREREEVFAPAYAIRAEADWQDIFGAFAARRQQGSGL